MAELLMANGNVDLENPPSDVMPPKDRNDIDIPDDELLSYLTNTLQEAIQYKEYLGWVEKREYDINSYYMQKDYALSQYPWKGSSNYRSPLTATLLDTAWAYMFDSVWPESGRPLQIKGYGKEDQRTARILENYMNNVLDSETNLRTVQNQNIFRTFLNGTGTIKTRREVDGFSISNTAVSIEDIYCPLYATGFRTNQTEYVHQQIMLTKSELEMRRRLGVYDFRDGEIAPGLAITTGMSKERTTLAMDVVSGQDMTSEQRNNQYFIVESYCTYYAKNSMRPIELIVWWMPNGGKILRKRRNESGIRPFSRYIVYDYPGRFYGMSLPEKIREIQAKLDYSDKQYTDMLDRAAMPAIFLDDTSMFDPDVAQRVPGGIYPIGVGNKMIFEPQPPVERGFDQERFNLWMQAEKLTGLIDVVQGASTRSGRTLGETEIRQNAAGVRFSALFKRYEEGFNETCKIYYEYEDRYAPRSKKVSIIGYEDYQTLGELFPSNGNGSQYGLGLNKQFNFAFSGHPVSEQENDRRNFDDYYLAAMSNPVVASNPANFARLLREKAEKNGIRNHDSLVQKIREENFLSAEEYIQRVMSGQYNLKLRPGIDAEEYILEIEMFIRTETFLNMDNKGKMAIFNALQMANIISMAEIKALQDMQAQQQMMMQGQSPQPSGAAVQ